MTRSFAHPVAHVCRVCGRPAQIDELCGRHGGSVGLIIQTEGLPRLLRIGLRFMVAGADLTFVLGLLTLLIGGSLTGREDSPGAARLAGLVMMIVGIVALLVAMYLSQLRTWAFPTALALCAGVGILSIVGLVVAAPSSSFNTLLIAGTVIPFLGAAVLFAVWRARESREIVQARTTTGSAAAPS
jgi:hypothetical protein